MCGISGIYGLKSTDVAYRYVTGMNDAIAHRGPDDDGLFVEENIALGHRRLAILDLSPAGHQPMFDHYENLCIELSVKFMTVTWNQLTVETVFTAECRIESNEIIWVWLWISI